MSKRVCTFLLLIILSSTLASTTTTAQSEPAPYIYYHSTVLNAFVIERADGTDSRIIGKDITPFDQRAYPRPGWSPSGQWLVWTSSIVFDGPADLQFDPWGVSLDGKQRLTLLDNVFDVRSIEWSPSEDLLFMLHDRTNMQATLIDAGSNQIVMSSELDIYDGDLSWITWTPDGKYATFYYKMYPDNDPSRPRQYFLRTVSREGEISDRQVSVINCCNVFSRTRPHYSSNGWLLYASPDKTKLIADHVSTGERYEFDMPPGDILSIEWSPSGNYAALFARERCDGFPDCPNGLWFLSPSDQLLEKVGENISLQTGYIEQNFWSPQRETGIFLTLDGFAHIVEADPLTVTDVELPVDDNPNYTFPENPRPYWFPSGDRWLIPEIRYVIGQKLEAYIYDLDTKQGEIHSFGARRPLFSADSFYYVDMWGESTMFRVNSFRGELLPRHSGTYFYGNQVALFSASWHPESAWLLTGVAHNPNSIYLPASVTSADGKVYRELGSCYACVDWLPEQVDLANLTPGTPTSVVRVPDNTFDTGAWVDGLQWSPDGTRLAVGQLDLYSNTRDPLKVQQWELNAAEPTQLFSILVPPDTSLDWQKDEDDNYILLPDEDGKALEVFARIDLSKREIIAFSPDGNLAIRYDENYNVLVTDETTSETLYTLPLIADSRTGSLLAVFSPDGTIIAGVGPYSQLHIWDAATGALLTVLNVFSNALAFSPDGQWLATGMANKVALWDMTSIVSPESNQSSGPD